MWINCAKKLPPESEKVLAAHMYWSPNQDRFFITFIVVAQRLKYMWFDANFGHNLNLHPRMNEITHWCNLPSIPKR